MKKILILLVLSLLLGPAYAKDTHTVKRVISGDTLELESGEKVRLIGIDCPEMDTEEGKKAKEFVKGLVEGKEIRLQLEVLKRDTQGRMLAYVWYEIVPLSHIKKFKTPENFIVIYEKNKQGYNGTFVFLNSTILKSGYASSMAMPPNVKYADLFKELYKEAREAKRGLWSKESQERTTNTCNNDSECQYIECKEGWHKLCVNGVCMCISQ